MLKTGQAVSVFAALLTLCGGATARVLEGPDTVFAATVAQGVAAAQERTSRQSIARLGAVPASKSGPDESLMSLSESENFRAQNKNTVFGPLILGEEVRLGAHVIKTGHDWVRVTRVLKSVARECAATTPACAGGKKAKIFDLVTIANMDYFLDSYLPQHSSANYASALVCGETIKRQCSLRRGEVNKYNWQLNGALWQYVSRMREDEADGWDSLR